VVKRSSLENKILENLEFREFVRGITGSQAEYFQDLWVLGELNYKRGGFFVEFGATNGFDASNTWILENLFGWSGILVEPNNDYRQALLKNRNCSIDFRAVWDSSGEKVEFVQMEEAYLSVSKDDIRYEMEDKLRSASVNQVETISLQELLDTYSAPKHIDFLSVDVEGSELRILTEFFKERKYVIDLVAVEHNWKDEQSELLSLFTASGYRRVHPKFSHRDYWFKREIPA